MYFYPFVVDLTIKKHLLLYETMLNDVEKKAKRHRLLSVSIQQVIPYT